MERNHGEFTGLNCFTAPGQSQCIPMQLFCWMFHITKAYHKAPRKKSNTMEISGKIKRKRFEIEGMEIPLSLSSRRPHYYYGYPKQFNKNFEYIL